MANHLIDVDLVFSALADRTRRTVVQRLSTGPRSVSDLAHDFPIALPSFMKHIAALEASGLIRTRKTGRVRSCELNRAALGVIEHWLDAQRRAWEEQTDRLQAFVEHEAAITPDPRIRAHDTPQPRVPTINTTEPQVPTTSTEES